MTSTPDKRVWHTVPGAASSRPPRGRPWPLLLVFGLALAGITLIALLAFRVQSETIRNAQFATLEAVARLKVQTISQWVAERRANADSVSRNPVMRRVVNRLLAGDPGADPDDGRQFLAHLKGSYGYRSISLRDPSGRVVLAVGDVPPDSDTLQAAIATAQRTRMVAEIDLHRPGAGPGLALGMVAPVINPAAGAEAVSGVLVFDNDPHSFLYPQIQSWPLPSATGETVLVRRDGDTALYLNDLRFAPDAAFRLRLPLTTPELPAAVLLVNGDRARWQGVDYRGHPVLSVGLPVPGMPWTVIAKQDTAEALAEVNQLWLVTGALTLVAVLIASAVVALLWRRQVLSAALDPLTQRWAMTTAERQAWQRSLAAAGAGRRRWWHWRVLLAYGVTIAATLATALVRLPAISDLAGQQPLLILFLLPILLSAYLGGTGPGLVATLVAALTTNYFLLPPLHTMAIAHTVDLLQWLVLIGLGCAISLFIGALRRSRRQADSARVLHAVTLASIGDGIITSDRDGRVTFLNAEAERLTGWANHEAGGEPIERVFALVDGVLHARDGATWPIEARGTEIKASDGTVAGMVQVFRDISERKQAEAALTASETRYHTLFRDSPSASLLIDPESSRIADANAAASRFYGWSREELCQLKIHHINLSPAAEVSGAMAGVTDSRGVKVFFFQHRLASGAVREVEVHCSPVTIDGRPLLCSNIHDITERKQAEAALLESEQRFSAIFHGSPAGIAISDLGHHRFAYVNPVWETMLGYRQDEVTGRTGAELGLWLEPSHRDALYASTTAGTQVVNFETRLRTKAGALIDILFSARVITISGRPHLMGVISDISERRRMEQALREREAALETAQTLAQVGSWTADLATLTLLCSPEAARITGLSTEPLPFAQAKAIVHPDDLERMEAVWQRNLVEGSYDSEHRILVDGQVRWVHDRAQVTYDSDGRPLRITGMTHDITEAREAQLALKLANERLEATVVARTAELAETRNYLQGVLDNLPALIGYWESETCNRFANRAHFDWFGFSPEQIRTMTLAELIGPQVFELDRPYVEGVLRGEPQYFDRKLPYLHGPGLRHVQVTFIPDVQDGQVKGFFALVNDVTAIKQAELVAQGARQEAERLARLRSEFLANMSHEIRTPINAILGLAYLLGRAPLGASERDLVGKIRLAGRSLLAIINDILDFSKIEAGRLTLDVAPFCLSEVLDRIATVMATAAGGKPVELVVGPVPAGAEFLRGDALRLEQVLVNLVSNAIKFTEQGDVTVGVTRVDGSGEGPLRLRFVVHDSGIGIAPEHQQEIFSAFTQADSSTARRFGGTGLGLSICKRLLDLMGGEIGLVSALGAGSEFWFELPFEPAPPAVPGSSPLVHQHLLIADDHPVARATLTATAEALGWTVEAVASGEAARDLALARFRERRPFDALVLDWRMPGLDGLAASRAIHQGMGDQPPPIIILATAFTSDLLVQRPEAGVVDVILNKPVTSSALFNAVAEAKRRREGPPQSEPPSERLKRLAGVEALVVDDSPINLEVARLILEAEGATVVLAANGQEALDHLQRQPDRCHVVLMDVQMPVMDGYQATRDLRGRLALTELPVIAVTAGAFQDQQDAALAAGMSGFLAKPFEAEDLISIVQQLVAQARPAVAAGPMIVPSPPVPPLAAAPLPVPVLDTAHGLATWGNGATYRAYLRQFVRDYHDSGEQIFLLVQQQEPRQAAIAAAVAHKLTGAAGNLALRQVQRLAGALHRALLTPSPAPAGGAEQERDWQEVTALVGQLSAALEAATSEIEGFAGSPATSEAGPAVPDLVAAAPLLRQLLAALDRDRPDDAEPVLAALSEVLPAHLLRQVQEALDAFDFRRAEVATAVLADQLGLPLTE